MKSHLLLDTCAVIWVAGNSALSEGARAAITDALDADHPIFVSPISAWELGLLTALGRLSLQMSAERWFGELLLAPGIHLAEMPPPVLIASSFLPGVCPRDPADRIIVATAREYGYRVVTRDRQLLAYAEAGYFQALPC